MAYSIKYHRLQKCEGCGSEFLNKMDGGKARFRRFCTLRCSRIGKNNPLWKGDNANKRAGRERAIRMYSLRSCEKCGKPGTDRHHKDTNTLNNDPSNIEILCRHCHMTEDGRLAILVKNGTAALAKEHVKRRAVTHCHKGHEFTPENTARNNGGRGCKTCARAYMHEWHIRHYQAKG